VICRDSQKSATQNINLKSAQAAYVLPRTCAGSAEQAKARRDLFHKINPESGN
jgi:hypothetical protein